MDIQKMTATELTSHFMNGNNQIRLSSLTKHKSKDASIALIEFGIADVLQQIGFSMTDMQLSRASKDIYQEFYYFTFDEVQAAFKLIKFGKIELYGKLNIAKLYQAFEMVDIDRAEKIEREKQAGSLKKKKEIIKLSEKTEALIKETIEKLEYKDDEVKNKEAWELYQNMKDETNKR